MFKDFFHKFDSVISSKYDRYFTALFDLQVPSRFWYVYKLFSTLEIL